MGKTLIIAGIAVAAINTLILIIFAARPLKYEPTIYSSAAAKPNVDALKKEKAETASKPERTGTRLMGDEKTEVLGYVEEKTEVLHGNVPEYEEKTEVLHRNDQQEDEKTEVLNNYTEEKTRVLHSNATYDTDYEEDEKTRVLGETYAAEEDPLEEADEVTRVLDNGDEEKTAILSGKTE